MTPYTTIQVQVCEKLWKCCRCNEPSNWCLTNTSLANVRTTWEICDNCVKQFEAFIYPFLNGKI